MIDIKGVYYEKAHVGYMRNNFYSIIFYYNVISFYKYEKKYE